MACRLEVQHEIFDRSSSVSHTVQRQISDGSSLSVNHPVQRQISDGSSSSINHPVQRQITDGSSSSVNHPVQRQISDGSSSSVSHPVQRQISEGSSISVQQPVQRQISEGASLSVKQPVQKSSACVHPTPPKESPKELPSKAVWVQTCSSLTSDVDGTNLCLPSKTGTLVATVVTSSFAAMGLLCMGFSELGLPGATKTLWSTLLLRLAGWFFLIYFPVMIVVQPVLRNFTYWGLQPHQTLADAWPDGTMGCLLRFRRAYSVPCIVHFLALSTMVLWTILPFEEGYFGILPFFGGAAGIVLPINELCSRLIGPPMPSKAYAIPMLPLVGFGPTMMSGAVMAMYLALRHLGGLWIGLLMPLFLSAYELLGSTIISKRFTRAFLTQIEVREAYSSTNQGVVVSIGICNLHAMAEGARLTLLYADKHQNHDWSVLVPVLSGVCWNVMARIGCLDRFLHTVSRGRWKPNNTGKLLRESGYCMGYPRFGAILALFLARLCLGTPFCWRATEVFLLVIIFLAEVVEDIISWALWRAGVNVSPEKQFATDKEVEFKARRRLSRRLSSSSLSAVTPQPSRECNARMAEEEELIERWKVRVAHDFNHGPKEFDRLPMWAHFLPTALAQFHTIFAMMVVMNGAVFLLGLCDPDEIAEPRGLIWWPVTNELCS